MNITLDSIVARTVVATLAVVGAVACFMYAWKNGGALWVVLLAAAAVLLVAVVLVARALARLKKSGDLD